MMLSQVDQRAVVLVEGQEDTAVIDPHLNKKAVRSEIAHGKKAVLRAAEIAAEKNYANVSAVVDRDFDSELDLKKSSSRVSVSEFYDLQADIFHKCPRTLTRVLAAHSDRDKLDEHLDAIKLTAHELVSTVAGNVGALRYASIKGKLGILLKDFPMSVLIGAFEAGTLVEKISELAIARSKKPTKIDESALKALIEQTLVQQNLDHILCGHDVVNLLSALASQRWGGPSGADAMGRAYRSSTEWDCFTRLALYRDLREWGEDLGITVWELELVS